MIGRLTDPVAYGGSPEDAFHLVCPAPPGYGFSDTPSTSGWGIQRIADAWAVLMARLGYARYGARDLIESERAGLESLASRCWAARRDTDIRYWNEPRRGGHFAAMEEPEVIRAFFRLVR